MVAALIQWQLDIAGDGTWTDITGRVEGEGVFREGRNVEQLGGPEADGRTSSLTLRLDNNNGYFTKGAAAEFRRTGIIRLRWRKVATDAWAIRFRGVVSESRIDFDGHSFLRTRWLGALWKLKSGSIPERLAIGTIGEIATELVTAAGIATADQNFPTGGDDYGLSLRAGYPGVRDFLGLIGGTMFDGPDGRVSLETETVRAARAASQTYREGAGAGIQIAPPRSLTLPFGIINDLALQVQVFNPMGTAAFTSYNVPLVDQQAGGFGSRTFALNISLEFPPTSLNLGDWELNFYMAGNNGTNREPASDSTVDQDTILPFEHHFTLTNNALITFLGNDQYGYRISEVTWTLAGSLLRLDVTHTGETTMGTYPNIIRLYMSGTVEISQSAIVQQTLTTFDFAACDLESIERYGLRPRESPLLLAIRRTTPPPADYEPPTDLVNNAIAQELARYANPVPVVAVSLDSGTVARRDDLMDRLLGQKVHITANGKSQLGHDADFFVEAQEVRISAHGRTGVNDMVRRGHRRSEPPTAAAATDCTVTGN